MTFLFELLVVGLLITLLARVNRIERQSARAAQQLDEALRRLGAGLPAAQHPSPSAPSFSDASFPAPSRPAVPHQDSPPVSVPPPTPLGAPPFPVPGVPKLTPPLPQFPAQPTAVPRPTRPPQAPPAAPRPPAWWPAINLGAPEYSRARMSVIGGGLVIAGLAWTLRSLGLPGWTTLAAVYAFAALLWLTARSVPQPVAGAL
ncbi:hypothetical protein ACFFLM_24495, partial [Deinococcus oregonensis]